MKHSSRISSSAFLALVAAFVGVAPVQAFRPACVALTTAEAQEAADSIFLGRVARLVQVDVPRETSLWSRPQYVTLELFASWKTEGETYENRRVVIYSDGGDFCQPTYDIGSTWLVYGYETECDGVDLYGEPCTDFANGLSDGSQRVAYSTTVIPESLGWLESLGTPEHIYGDDLAMQGLTAYPLSQEGLDYMAPPFGKFRVNQAPWYKWEGNGWVYIAEFSNGGFWWYDQAASRWFFTDESNYPWLYTEGFDWIALDTAATSPNARWAYVTKYDQWMKLSALNAFEAPAAE